MDSKVTPNKQQSAPKKSIVDSDFTQKLRQGTSMFSRVGAGQSVNFMILDRLPETLNPNAGGGVFDSLDFDAIAEGQDEQFEKF